MIHQLTFVEDSFRDWQAKYPDDTWLPKFGYALFADFNLFGDALAT